jgi:hypothetical protein
MQWHCQILDFQMILIRSKGGSRLCKI